MAPQRSISRMIDEQVRRWEIQRKKAQRREEAVRPVVCVSREAGSGGRHVAKLIADTLGYSLFDKQIIEEVAKNAKLSTTVVESLDEKGRVALDEWFLVTISSRHIMPDQFLEHLMKVVGAVANHGGVVILGRGAGFIVKPEQAFRIRCVASMDSRVERWARELEVSEPEAEKFVLHADADRKAFIHMSFHADASDPDHYDLVLNTDKLGLEGAAKTACYALENFVLES